MKIFRHYDEVPAALKGAVVAVGNFDGVHLGHQALIAQAGGSGVRAASGGVFPTPSRFHPAHALAHQGAASG